MASKNVRLEAIEKRFIGEKDPERPAQWTNRHIANVLAYIKYSIPEAMIMADYQAAVDPVNSHRWKDECRKAAQEVLAEWQSQRPAPIIADVDAHCMPPWFHGEQVFRKEFEECTVWVHGHLPEIPLQEIRQAALHHILKGKHRIEFYLEDFGLEGLADSVRSSSSVVYRLTTEQYREILRYREQVAADPKQQAIMAQIDSNRTKRRAEFLVRHTLS